MAALQIVALLTVIVAGEFGCSAENCYSPYNGLFFYCYEGSYCCGGTCCFHYGFYSSRYKCILASLMASSVSIGFMVGKLWLSYRTHLARRRVRNRSLLNNVAPLAMAEERTYYFPPPVDFATVPALQSQASAPPMIPGQNAAFIDDEDSENS